MQEHRARSAPARRRPHTAKLPPPPPTDEQKATTEYAPVRKMVAKVRQPQRIDLRPPSLWGPKAGGGGGDNKAVTCAVRRLDRMMGSARTAVDNGMDADWRGTGARWAGGAAAA
jgi:hypothetical protein